MSGRVLLVDDEESLRITLAANLELEGFEVVEASSGEEALVMAQGRTFDIVLTDIRMPGMNGVELFRRLKTTHPQLPVVLMTAFATEELVDDGLRNGAFTLLSKPFDLDHAASVLARACKQPVVLVIDDEQPVAESAAAALVAVGLRACAVLDGRTALQRIASGDVDVCVVDLVMPGMDGAELVDRLKRLDASVAVIAVSGHSVPEMLGRVAAAGAFRCMQKPLAPAELVDTIARARGAAKRVRR